MKWSHIGLAIDVVMFLLALTGAVFSISGSPLILGPAKWIVFPVCLCWIVQQLGQWHRHGNRWRDVAWDEPISDSIQSNDQRQPTNGNS